MKYRILLIAFCVAIYSLPSFAQKKNPKKKIVLQMNDGKGSNGGGVAYNPSTKYYYAAFAGNESYPVATFTSKGDNLKQTDVGADVRGFWWNPSTKSLEINCYLDGGWQKILLDDKGYAGKRNEIIFDGDDHQPNEQACGALDPKNNEVLFLEDDKVKIYDRKTGKMTGDILFLNLPTSLDNINKHTLIFTGKKKKEIGLLDHTNKKVYFFSREDGTFTKGIELPENAPTEEWFNWSFANGHIFLFDKDNRRWLGYKIL